MGCCKNLVVAQSIIAGNISLAVENLLGISFHKCPQTRERVAICNACGYRTYISKREFIVWILTNKSYVIINIANLVDAPLLPARSDKTREYNLRFCNFCKCYTTAKARLVNETCEKWEHYMEKETKNAKT